jgi:hypothetical protein
LEHSASTHCEVKGERFCVPTSRLDYVITSRPAVVVTILVFPLFFEDVAITPFLTKCFDHFVIARILLVKADTVINKGMG